MALAESTAKLYELVKEQEAVVYQLAHARWHKGSLRYKLHDAQLKIYDAIRNPHLDSKEVVVLCARRFGKSYLGTLMAIEDCLQNPGVYVRIIGPEIQQTVEIIEPLIDKISRDAPPGLIKRVASQYRWRVGKSWLVVGGFDNKNIRRHLGKESHSIYIEETGSSNPEDYVYAQMEVLVPHLLHSRGKRVHLTTPPLDEFHPFVTNVIPKAQLRNAFFKFTIYQNPLLSDDMIREAIEESGGIETDAFKRNYLCEIITDKKLTCVPTFDKLKHAIPKIAIPTCELGIPRVNWVVFGDAGGIMDKTWIGIGFFDFARAKMCIIGERVFEPNTASSVITSSVLQLEAEVGVPAGTARWVDVPGQIQIDWERDHRFHVRVPLKDDFDAAINQLVLAFLYDKIEIQENCQFLIVSLQSGKFNKKRTDFERTEALGHCDGIAGLMYGWRMCDKTTNPFPAPIRNHENTFFTKPNEASQLEKLADSFGKVYR